MPEGDNSTYTANEDGSITVKDAEGKEIRFVKEADLLAVKGSAEAAERRAKSEVETAKGSLNQTHQQLLQAEAQVETLKEELAKGTGTVEELAKVKQDLETAQGSAKSLGDKVLEYRKQIIVATFKVSPDAVKDKTLEQLDLFEDALKAVGAGKGAGNFAIGGGAGGTSLAGKNPMELARLAYQNTK
jgi:DNA repair exonuclease SbcCD ATPase subunit